MKKIIYIGILLASIFPIAVMAQTAPGTVSNVSGTAVPAGQNEFGAATTPPSYVLLAPLPCVGTANNSNGTSNGTTCTSTNGASEITSISIQGYLLYIYKLMIALAVFLAVIMTIFGGFKYMTVESVMGKGDAKKTIEDAIWGLLLALASYLILYTINPTLVDVSKVAIPKLNVAASQSTQNAVSELSSAANQAAIASDAAVTSNKASLAQAQTNLQTAQNNTDNIQNQIDDCDNGVTNCSDAQYSALQSQLSTAQQAETTANNQVTTQSALSNINSQIVQGSRLLSEASTSAIQNSDAISGITANQANLQSSYNSAVSALTANGNNDPADIQTLNQTYLYASSTLADEQALAQASANPVLAASYLQTVTQEDAAMATNASTTLQQQYKAQSTATKAALQTIINNNPPPSYSKRIPVQ